MTIDTQKLREYSATEIFTSDDIRGLLDHIEAQADEIEALRSHNALLRGSIAQVERENDRLREPWQPIETAPRGATVLLGWHDCLGGAWAAEVGMASWGWKTKSVSNISAHGRATHWMPLPAAPGAALSGDPQ